MGKILQLNATTRAERHLMIELAKDAITDSGGWILNFTLFSNISINLNYQLPQSGVMALRDKLLTAEFQLSDESLQALEKLAVQPAQGINQEHLIGTLQITFIHDEPDLRIPVPMIPG